MVMTVDVMHTLYLGVMLAFAEKVVWHMLLAGAWAMSTSADEQVAMSAKRIRSDFQNWMRQYHAAHPDEVLTPVKIHKKLFGDISNKTLRTKASQTWTFLLYLMHAMDQRYNSLGATGPILVGAGAALVGLVRTFQKATHWMSGESFAMAWEYWKTFVSLTEADARQLIPKGILCSTC